MKNYRTYLYIYIYLYTYSYGKTYKKDSFHKRPKIKLRRNEALPKRNATSY